LERILALLKPVGDILFIWLVWSIFFLFFCSLGNFKDLNYERTVYIALTNLTGISCGYIYARCVKNK